MTLSFLASAVVLASHLASAAPGTNRASRFARAVDALADILLIINNNNNNNNKYLFFIAIITIQLL